MDENKTNAGEEEEKPLLDAVEEALVGSHQEVPPDDDEPAEGEDRPFMKSP